MRFRLAALGILFVGILVGYFVYASQARETLPFRLGLDLAGGTQLVYRADTSSVSEGDEREAMSALRDVIERRVNLFGVAEPRVQAERSGAVFGERQERLLVELPGVTDIDEAVALIGETPLLEFKLLRGENVATVGDDQAALPDELFEDTGLTGAFVRRAQLSFGSGNTGASEPFVSLTFNSEGAELFREITGGNVGEVLAIFLDGAPISLPVIQSEIVGGTAQITGRFSPEEARELARDLNFGALPLPIELIATQSVGASLGEASVKAGIQAGLYGLIAVALFLLLWYRVPGFVAVFSLAIYVVVMLALFKLIPVTLTAAGIAGFILSIGMAVDANILIFERIKEERLKGQVLGDAVTDGFARAWCSIRDANISSLITAAILFWFGTSLVQGFALTFGIGVLISMLSAISVARTFLRAVAISKEGASPLFGVGVGK